MSSPWKVTKYEVHWDDTVKVLRHENDSLKALVGQASPHPVKPSLSAGEKSFLGIVAVIGIIFVVWLLRLLFD